MPSFSQSSWSGYPAYPADVYTTDQPHLSLLAGWADQPAEAVAYADAWSEPATGWSPGSRKNTTAGLTK